MAVDNIRLEMPIEFINITPCNPLISKCQIKVCWVGDTPNRNRSIITKDTARQMANSLPGSPIVGYYNEEKGDFEEHNRIIDISNGQFKIKDTTKPYGFVDLNAKVWFQNFLDPDGVTREYMVTEGYLWTGQYKEAQRVIDKGNNQSMELDEDTLDAVWTRDNNGKPKFFIINEAIISKLCILGEECEPCFEGSTITSFSLSFDEDFKVKLFSMMEELKDLLNKGGTKVFTRYNVEIGDALWTALYSYVTEKYADYGIEGVYEEDGQLFTILSCDNTYSRLNFSFVETEFSAAEELVALNEYTPDAEPQFTSEAIAEYAEKKKKEEEEDKDNSEDEKKSEDTSEGKKDVEEDDEEEKKKKKEFAKEEDEEKVCPKCGKPLNECTCEDEEEKNTKHSLETLQSQYSELENKYNTLVSEKETLEAELNSLKEFKLSVEREKKQEMINSFYMLSEEDKADVIQNIDTYSLEDIEGKLSIICVRKKVNFNLDENKEDVTTFNLSGDSEVDNAPAWVKAAREVKKEIM